MSEMVSIFHRFEEKFDESSDDLTLKYKDEIFQQVIRPTGDHCDVFKELTFILVRYSSSESYYKDLDPFLPPQKNDWILQLLHSLRSFLANRIMNLFQYALNRSKIMVKKFVKTGILISTNFLLFVSSLDLPGLGFKENLQFQTSLIEFCEFVSVFKKVGKCGKVDSDDLEFLFACCVHFGFNHYFKLDRWRVCLGRFESIFEKYSDELKRENVDFRCFLIYSTFDSFSNVKQSTLKDVADCIFSCYDKVIHQARKGIYKALEDFEVFKGFDEETFTKQFSENLLTWDIITKNYLKISHFLNWKISRKTLKSDALSLRNSFRTLINHLKVHKR
jgi:hypothetical protein